MESSLSPGSATRLDQCESCGVALPLCTSIDECRVWVCRCGREYTAELHPEYTIDELRNVHPGPVVFNKRLLTPLPEAMLDYVRENFNVEPSNVEKRSALRRLVIQELPALAVDEMLRPLGQPFMTVSRDLSTGGLGLIHNRAITAPFLVLQLATASGSEIQVLMRVLRSRPRGSYHDVAGELVTRLAASTSKLLR